MSGFGGLGDSNVLRRSIISRLGVGWSIDGGGRLRELSAIARIQYWITGFDLKRTHLLNQWQSNPEAHALAAAWPAMTATRNPAGGRVVAPTAAAYHAVRTR